MKKLLFIVTQSEFGGAQHFLAHFTTALDKNKYNVLVGAGPRGDDETGLLSFLEKKGINTRHLKYLRRAANPLFDFLGLIEIRRLIKKEKPDTVFLCSSKAGVLGSLAGRLAGVSKIIYRVGGWVFNDPRSSLSRAFYKFIEKFSAKWKDTIIFNSEHDRKQAVELKIRPKKKLLTIYNGLDIKKLDFLPREKAREKIFNRRNTQIASKQSSEHADTRRSSAPISVLPEAPDQRVSATLLVGCIANLYPAKGLEYLIKSASLLKDKNIKFIVLGEGQERKKLEDLIKKYHLENNFFLIGAIPDAYKYLKAFDVFVLPSVKEGFPWTILEAMAAEVPIVATKVGAIPEIQPGILVEPRKSKQLAKAIESLIKSTELREKLTREARKKVEEEFNLDKMIKAIEKLL